MTNNYNEIKEKFIRISNLREDYLTLEEKKQFEKKSIQNGIKKFKNEIFGYFGFLKKDIVKSPNDLAKILFNLGGFKDISEAKEFIPKMYGLRLIYDKFGAGGIGPASIIEMSRHIALNRVENSDDELIKISKGECHLVL